MNRIHTKLAKAVALVAIVSAPALATAAGSTTLAVSAGILGTCKFSAASTPLAFVTIDPSGTTNAVVTANVLYKCSKNTPSLGVTATGGLARNMTDGGLNSLPYTLAFTGDASTGTGFGGGQDLTMVVTGTITPAQYQNAVATSFTENVTLNITP